MLRKQNKSQRSRAWSSIAQRGSPVSGCQIMFLLQFPLDTVADAQDVPVKWPKFSREQIFQAEESLVEG